jgi:hypothetical protein
MSAYEITREAIQLAPFLLVPAIMYAFRRFPRPIQLTAVVLLGWLGWYLLVRWYWSFSIDHAPTQELAEDLTTRDGAAMTFAYLFGWLYVAVYVAIIKGVLFLVSWGRRHRRPLGAV